MGAPALATDAHAGAWHYTDVTGSSGTGSSHGLAFGPFGEPDMMSGGVAAADVDGDGWVDLLVLRGDLGPARLLRNLGNGQFADEAAARGLVISSGLANGALLADVDGDGDVDALVGGLYVPDAGHVSPPRLWRNDGSGQFSADSTFLNGWDGADSWSAALGDVDGDGDLDLALGRWSNQIGARPHLFRNDAGTYVDADLAWGLAGQFPVRDRSFTPNFADIDSDGDADLLLTGDFGSSRVFRNDGAGYSNQTTAVISDENGMGAAVADYDNDGDLDWFVSAIYDSGTPAGNWGSSGNRLYRNEGNGQYSDVTDQAGVRNAGWGWGSCFADFNADGWLDLYVVNGMLGPTAATFNADPARMYINNGDGGFSERGAELGVADTGQGRGLACFDYDRDGDIDLYLQNGYGSARLLRNELPSARTLRVRLRGAMPNAGAIGARVTLEASAGSQLRELSAGNHFLSSSPSEAHFGLGSQIIGAIEVCWPDGRRTRSGAPTGRELSLAIDQIHIDGVE